MAAKGLVLNTGPNKEELAQLWEGIKSEAKFGSSNQQPVSFFESFLSICKELVDMIIKFVEEQAQKVIDFVTETKEQILSLDYLKLI